MTSTGAYPPGCTQADVDRAMEGDEPLDPPTEEEQRAEAWEYWHQRANTLEGALHAISQLEGLTLIAPSLGEDADRGHQLGANKAFNQAAAMARSALTGGFRE